MRSTDQTPDDPRIISMVTRASTRDQAAFAELYAEYLARVYRYMYSRTANHCDAEDLTAQVFLQAWSAIDRFRWPGRPFLAWLYTVCHNVFVDSRRRSTPSSSLDESALNLESASASNAIAQWIDADLLAGAIQRLTHTQQRVITLRFLEDLDTQKVARIMDKREGAVRALQLRALLSLRRELQSQDEDPAAAA